MLTIRRRGKFFHARGRVPMRQADGRIVRIAIEESTRETSKARALRVAADIAQHYQDQAYRPRPKSVSFTEAAITYVESKNPSKRDKSYAAKLVEYFGETPISEIDQARVAEAANRLYPGCSNATHCRAVYAPISTILHLCGVRPELHRPKISHKMREIPPEDWFSAVMRFGTPRLNALLIFITLTGRRITEALQAIDNGDGTYTVRKTKVGNSVVGHIPDSVGKLLGGSKLGSRLFTYGDRHNVYRELRKVCRLAGIPYYGTHAIGRHSFATRLLREGKSLKFVAEAGGWASIKMPAQHYAHLERSEVQEAVTDVGNRWAEGLVTRQKSQNPNT